MDPLENLKFSQRLEFDLWKVYKNIKKVSKHLVKIIGNCEIIPTHLTNVTINDVKGCNKSLKGKKSTIKAAQYFKKTVFSEERVNQTPGFHQPTLYNKIYLSST